jgi:hypothetical protein
MSRWTGLLLHKATPTHTLEEQKKTNKREHRECQIRPLATAIFQAVLVVIPNLSMQDPVSALIPSAPYYVLDTPMYTSLGYLQQTSTHERESDNDARKEEGSLVKGGLAQRSGALLRGAGSSDGP